MPKLKISQGKDGIFHARVFAKVDENGKRPSKRIDGHSKKEVEQKAAAFLAEMEANPRSYRMTLSDASQKYLEYLSSKKKPLSPSTLRSYIGIAKNHFKSLHNIAIVDITEDMIQNEIYALEDRLTAKTIENIVNFFVPCIHHFRRSFNPDLDLPEKEKPKIEIPDMQYLRSRIGTIKNKRLLVPVLLAAYCGLRRSEIAALDLNRDVEYDIIAKIPDPKDANSVMEYRVCHIHINHAVVRGAERYVEKGTKTDAGGRTLVGADWLNDILKEARDDESYEPYPPHKISTVFSEWSKKEKIGCSFHGLRHFYASIGEALNIPDLYMMDSMGHSTPNMLMQYKEIMQEKRVEVNQTLLKYMQNNSPFAPLSAPLPNINDENASK